MRDHEDRRGADPGHDAKALFLSAGDDLSARVSDAGTARLAHDRSVLPGQNRGEPSIDLSGIGIVPYLLDPEFGDGARMPEQLQIGARILRRFHEEESDPGGPRAHGGRNGGFERAV